MDTEYYLIAFSVVSTVLVHEWLHSSDVTQDLPELGVIGGVGPEVGSVSVGLAILVAGGTYLNYWVNDMES